MDDIEFEIAKLKRERNAVILAHWYQDSEIRDLADFLGDRLALAQRAARTQADVMVLAGVRFMAETAKILNPERTVLLPDMEAGCSQRTGARRNRFGLGVHVIPQPPAADLPGRRSSTSRAQAACPDAGAFDPGNRGFGSIMNAEDVISGTQEDRCLRIRARCAEPGSR